LTGSADLSGLGSRSSTAWMTAATLPWHCRGMTSRPPVPAAALVVLVAGGLAPASQAAGASDGYAAYVACSYKASAKPAHECKLSESKAAFFVSTKRDATYKVCVKFPSKKQRLCASAQDAPEDKVQFVSIATADVGVHKVKWYVGGKKVASWRLEVTEG